MAIPARSSAPSETFADRRRVPLLGRRWRKRRKASECVVCERQVVNAAGPDYSGGRLVLAGEPAMVRLAVLLSVILLPHLLPAQGLEFVKANYTKYEYRVPMRDGVRLFTAVYVPKDEAEKHPVLLTRTPYSCQPYGVDQY